MLLKPFLQPGRAEYQSRQRCQHRHGAKNQRHPQHRLTGLYSRGSKRYQSSHPFRSAKEKGCLDCADNPSAPHSEQDQEYKNNTRQDVIPGPDEMCSKRDEAERHGKKLYYDQSTCGNFEHVVFFTSPSFYRGVFVKSSSTG